MYKRTNTDKYLPYTALPVLVALPFLAFKRPSVNSASSTVAFAFTCDAISGDIRMT